MVMSFRQVCVIKNCAIKFCTPNAAFVQVGTSEVGTSEVCIVEFCHRQIPTAQVGIVQVHIGKVEVECLVIGKGADISTVNITNFLPWIFNPGNHFSVYVFYLYHFDYKGTKYF